MRTANVGLQHFGKIYSWAQKIIYYNNNNRRYASSGLVPDLTAVRYNVKRGSYNEINGTHVKFFEDLLGHVRVITDPTECYGYNVDWLKMVRGKI